MLKSTVSTPSLPLPSLGRMIKVKASPRLGPYVPPTPKAGDANHSTSSARLQEKVAGKDIAGSKGGGTSLPPEMPGSSTSSLGGGSKDRGNSHTSKHTAPMPVRPANPTHVTRRLYSICTDDFSGCESFADLGARMPIVWKLVLHEVPVEVANEMECHCWFLQCH